MAIRIGLTGGIGSGKSVVSHLLQVMSVPVFDTDREAKNLVASDKEIRKELCALVGEELFADNLFHKQMLADYLFGNEQHARLVNQIIHPAVKKEFLYWTHLHSEASIVGIESAILIEAGFSDTVDYIIMVYAPLEVRISRVMQRDNCTREQVVNRIKSQMDDEEKKAKAHFIIVNDNETPLIPQILRLILSIRNQNLISL